MRSLTSMDWQTLDCEQEGALPGLRRPVLCLQGAVNVQVEPQDKVQALRDQVDGVKNIMTENVERILARGERLDDLMDKSEGLQEGVSASVHELLV